MMPDTTVVSLVVGLFSDNQSSSSYNTNTGGSNYSSNRSNSGTNSSGNVTYPNYNSSSNQQSSSYGSYNTQQQGNAQNTSYPAAATGQTATTGAKPDT